MRVIIGERFIGPRELWWEPIIDKGTGHILTHSTGKENNLWPRFVIGKWWCSPSPNGIWWEQIIDKEIGQVWFHNRTARYLRPWKAGDERIRHGYVETNAVWAVRPIHLPSREKAIQFHTKRAQPYEERMLVITSCMLVNRGIKRVFKTIMDYVRFHEYQNGLTALSLDFAKVNVSRTPMVGLPLLYQSADAPNDLLE